MKHGQADSAALKALFTPPSQQIEWTATTTTGIAAFDTLMSAYNVQALYCSTIMCMQSDANGIPYSQFEVIFPRCPNWTAVQEITAQFESTGLPISTPQFSSRVAPPPPGGYYPVPGAIERVKFANHTTYIFEHNFSEDVNAGPPKSRRYYFEIAADGVPHFVAEFGDPISAYQRDLVLRAP